MKSLAKHIMKGRMHAAIATLAGVLFLPFSGAAVGLVTLRLGAKEGLTTIALALMLAAIISLLIERDTHTVLLGLSLFWLSIWLLALVLRKTISLAVTLTCLGLVGAMLVLKEFLAHDPLNHWRAIIAQQWENDGMRQLWSSFGFDTSNAGLAQATELLIRIMPGVYASYYVLLILFSLLLARSWQAALYNPGGFGTEFRKIQLSRPAAATVLCVILLAIFSATPLFESLRLPLLMVALVFGLSVIHALANVYGAAAPLVVFYLLMFLLPIVPFMVSLLGVLDAWVDVRKRFRKKP